jgi:uncharacterized protein (TIGR02646 family)
MIFVARSPKPTILVKNEKKWITKLMTAPTKVAKDRAIARYRHKKIKAALEAMFHGKCAYCESQIRHIAYTNIEHFHPRNGAHGDEALTFSWDNLLLSCSICNGPQYKSDKFPDAAAGGSLLNPCVDNPDDHLDFQYDPVAKIASVRPKTNRGKTTESTIGLNRFDLRTHRSKQVTRIAVIAKLAARDPEAAHLLSESKQPNAEYSRFANLF